MARDASTALIGGVTRELLQLAMMSVTLALLSPRLFAVFVGGIAPLLLLFQKLGKKLKQRATASLANYAAMTEWLQQRLLGIETIKHYHTEGLEQDKFFAVIAYTVQNFSACRQTTCAYSAGNRSVDGGGDGGGTLFCFTRTAPQQHRGGVSFFLDFSFVCTISLTHWTLLRAKP